MTLLPWTGPTTMTTTAPTRCNAPGFCRVIATLSTREAQVIAATLPDTRRGTTQAQLNVPW